jgi:lipopolysaccharide heptosyltransferase II
MKMLSQISLKKLRYILDEIINSAPRRIFKIPYRGRPQYILIIYFQGIGNTVLFTPVLQTLRKAYPDARIITVLAPRGAKEVISDSGLVDELIEYDIKADKKGSTLEEIAAYLRPKNIDLGFTYSWNLKAIRLLFEAGARYRVGFSYPYRWTRRVGFLLHTAVELDINKHEVLHNLDLLKAIGICNFEIHPTFYFNEENLNSAMKKLTQRGIKVQRHKVGFHTGSYADLAKKIWPAEYFAALADMLLEHYDVQIMIVGGLTEQLYVEKIIKKMRHKNVVNLAGLFTLKETAALMSTFDCFISNDSGPMHIAAGVGTPVIGIFGPTRETKNSPWSHKGIPAEVVRVPMDCAPCYVPYSSHISCEHIQCLRKLTPDIVFKKFAKMIEKRL